MGSIPNAAADPLPTPLSIGHASLLGSTGPVATATDGLFEREVDLALERSGGAQAVEARQEAWTRARRGERRAGFERYREERSRSRTRERDLDRAPATSPSGVHPTEPRSGARASDEVGARAETLPRDGGAARERASASPRSDDPRAAAPAVNARATASPSPGPVANAAASSSSWAPAVAAARPASSVGAITAVGARPAAAAALAEARVARPSAQPLPQAHSGEELEHAAEVLRQLRVRLRGARGGQEVRVQLAPEELGRLSIRMRLEEGTLTTRVRVESPRTLELLERQAPELRALLQSQGFEAERIELELFEGGRDGYAEHGTREHADSGELPGRGPAREESAPATPARPNATSAVPTDDGVDTYA